MGNLGYAFTWLKNMRFGSWKVNVVLDGMPQKVATAFGELSETLVGAVYDPIAYLGSQTANGTNHAVLAKQTIVAGVDHTNIVILKFNEKGMNCSLYGIEMVMQSGGAFGGFTIDPKVKDDIPKEAMEAFKTVTEGWVGADIEPIAYLGSKVVKGIDVVFLAQVTGVYPGAEPEVKLIVVNGLTRTIDFEDIL